MAASWSCRDDSPRGSVVFEDAAGIAGVARRKTAIRGAEPGSRAAGQRASVMLDGACHAATQSPDCRAGRRASGVRRRRRCGPRLTRVRSAPLGAGPSRLAHAVLAVEVAASLGSPVARAVPPVVVAPDARRRGRSRGAGAAARCLASPNASSPGSRAAVPPLLSRYVMAVTSALNVVISRKAHASPTTLQGTMPRRAPVFAASC